MDAGELTIRLTQIERMARQCREGAAVVAHLSSLPKTPLFDAQGQDPHAPQRAIKAQNEAIVDQCLNELFRLSYQLHQVHTAKAEPEPAASGHKLALVGEGP